MIVKQTTLLAQTLTERAVGTTRNTTICTFYSRRRVTLSKLINTVSVQLTHLILPWHLNYLMQVAYTF